jgi:hypothetical protein
MSLFESGADESDPRVEPVTGIQDEDVPARRLLAHDLEHTAWDYDGEDGAPPPD